MVFESDLSLGALMTPLPSQGTLAWDPNEAPAAAPQVFYVTLYTHFSGLACPFHLSTAEGPIVQKHLSLACRSDMYQPDVPLAYSHPQTDE
jgi:hypothetical protein